MAAVPQPRDQLPLPGCVWNEQRWSRAVSNEIAERDDRIRIVGIGGSVAPNSKSRSALDAALSGAEDAGARTRLFDLHQLDLPMFNPTLLGEPPLAAVRLAEAAYAADGLLWSSPMYHGTISGAFKNALDWLYLLGDRDPPYLAAKVLGLISTAGGTQGLQAVNTMEFIVRSLRAWAVRHLTPPNGRGQRRHRSVRSAGVFC